MSSPQEAIIFIPGLSGFEKDYALNLLSLGLTEQLQGVKVQEIGEAKIEGHSGKKFSVSVDVEHVKYVDIYEVYWTDFLNRLSQKELREKVFRGIYLLIDWVFSKTWLSLFEAPALFFSLIGTLILMVLWYYGIVAIALTAIQQNPNLLGFSLPEKWPEFLGSLGKQMGGWTVWLIISAIISFIPVNRIIDIIDFVSRYLDEDFEGKSIRAKIRNRVLETLEDVINQNVYDRVTIVSHSLGVVIGTDLLASYHPAKPIRYISWGGPLTVLSYKAKWIDKKIENCLNNENLTIWIDCYSDQDWICTKTHLPKGCHSSKIQYHRSDLEFSFFKQLTGKTHNAYFTDEAVLQKMVETE